MKTSVMNQMREWLFPVAVLLTWGVGVTYTLTRLGEAHQAHAIAAAARIAPERPAPVSPFLASAE
jgi:hypothetical protein